MYYHIWVASQRFHGRESLTYSSEVSLESGQIVIVPLMRTTVLGIVAQDTVKPTFQVKPVLSSTDICLPVQSLELLSWMKTYYPAPLGSLVELFTPPPLTKKPPVLSKPETLMEAATKNLPPLTILQKKAIEATLAAPAKSLLLHGITGSGKTRIYVELAVDSVKSGQSVLVLTPEIGLTRQLLDTFSQTFGQRVIVTHSDMTPAQRRKAWLRINSSIHPLIIIGPRSALFAPIHKLGLLIMDEAHDTAYKQEQSPYYQASRVAAQLARLHNARFIMGTATPAIVDYFAFQQKNLQILTLDESAIPITQTTTHTIIDQREKALFSRSSWLATPLLKAIDRALERQEQALLFLNRRGSARLVFCEHCGWQALCPHCDVPLTYHQDQHLMRCHSCNFSGATPSSCPQCGASKLIFKSIGTKALEAEVAHLYPSARVARFDRDTERSASLSNSYSSLHSGDIDILIGTQAVAKGFDLPKLSVVGIVQADSGLQIPDYTASERTFQLLSQVSGRIGRGHRAGSLFVQTYEPDSPLIALALSKDYESFYEQELEERKLYNFPPYTYILKVTCTRANAKSAIDACEKVAQIIQNSRLRVQVEGPSPRFIERVQGRYAWHLIIKSPHRTKLLEVIALLPTNCTYDLDPSNLL